MGVETSSDHKTILLALLSHLHFAKKSFKSKWVKLKTLSLSSTRPTKATMLMPSTWATSSARWARRESPSPISAPSSPPSRPTPPTGVKEDYIEGLKVFDKDGTGKVPLPEVKNVLVSLGEKLEGDEADKLCTLLGLVADDEDMIPYMEFIDKLLAATA